MTKAELPPLALSVRQPWAWAIIFAGKDIENRSWQAVNHGLSRRGKICVHAAKGMTQKEYQSASIFIEDLTGKPAPAPHHLLRGGIIGTVEVVDVVKTSESPWFFGPRGLVLADPQATQFVPALGALGYFRWNAVDGGSPAAILKWMQPKPSCCELSLFLSGGAS